MSKHQIVLIITFCFISVVQGQKNFTPEETRLLDDGRFICKYEVSVGDWMGYIVSKDFAAELYPDLAMLPASVQTLYQDLKKGKEMTYLKIIENTGKEANVKGPKSIEETKEMKILEKDDSLYFSLIIPVTGISYQQVLGFLQWKKELLEKQTDNKSHFRVELPSVKDYKWLIKNVDSFCTGKCNDCKKYLINCKKPKCNIPGEPKYIVSVGLRLARKDFFWPNIDGLYCIQGNASEMTSTEGVAMGGSYIHYARDSFKDRNQMYKGPEPWLGFRYIITRLDGD